MRYLGGIPVDRSKSNNLVAASAEALLAADGPVQLISAASYQRMTTPEGPARAFHYGFGLETGRLRDQPMLSHGGGIHGFVSTLNYLPQSRTTVVILRNSDGPGFDMGLAARKLAAFAIGEPFAEPTPVAVPAEQLRSVEGLCAFDDSQANTPRRAHVPQVDAQLDFSGTEGPAATLTLLQGGRTLVMARR